MLANESCYVSFDNFEVTSFYVIFHVCFYQQTLTEESTQKELLQLQEEKHNYETTSKVLLIQWFAYVGHSILAVWVLILCHRQL